MAENNIIETVIKKYLDNNITEDVQVEFQAWMLNSRNWEEKEKVLNDFADSLNPEFDFNRYKTKLKKLRSEIDSGKIKKDNSRLARLGYLAAVACILIAFISFSYAISRKIWPSKETTVFVTSAMNKGSFTLPDGSTVFLNSSSRLEVPSDFNRKNRVVRLDGEGYFEVIKDTQYSFKVISHLATIKVLGTAFDMKAYSSEEFAEVVLVRGSVEVSGGNLTEPVVMSPNDKLTISNGASIEKVSARNYTSWTGNPLEIDNMPLKDILTNIERWYNVEFIAIGNADLSPHLTFVIRDENIESILNQISHVTSFKYYIKYNIKGNKIYYSTN